MKIWGPGGELAKAPLVHNGHGEAQAAVQRGCFDEATGSTGADGEAGELGDSGHDVAFGEVAEGSDGETLKGAVAELKGVAAFDSMGLHPTLEGTYSSTRRGGGGGHV